MTSPDYAHHFGPQNIPFGIASSKARPAPHVATRVQNRVIFLKDLVQQGILVSKTQDLSSIFSESTLNTFAALPKSVHQDVRKQIQNAISGSDLKAQEAIEASSEDIKSITMHLPVYVRDFTDFSASRDHMRNASEAIMGVQSLPPSFFSYPCAYGGRASSIRVSGQPCPRPYGQFLDRSTDLPTPTFGPEPALDYELEIGAIVGKPVKDVSRPHAKDADEHIFGLVLLNDWSARAIQGYEMNPLGPFNGKNFATSISPWVITLDALETFRVPAPERESPVADFLNDPNSTNFDLNLTVDVIRNGTSTTTCKVNFDTMYWTFRQMLAHHTISGCGMDTGDIFASGTVSKAGDDEHGCLLESTKGGKIGMKLNGGEELRYLLDGDVVRFTGVFGKEVSGVGFGDCVGQIIHTKPSFA